MVRIILILLIIGTHILAKLTAAAYSSQQSSRPSHSRWRAGDASFLLAPIVQPVLWVLVKNPL
jgi:hypothetical protein